MDALPSGPSAPPETPDETIRRLTAELHEAREQQAATTEILEIINRSGGDPAPVFAAILEKALALTGAAHGALATYDGEYFRAAALHAMPEPFGALLRQPFRSSAGGSAQHRLLQGERLIHIPDVTAIEPATPIQRASIDAGVRTLLVVALRKEERLLGYITAHRREVRPFSEKQIALLQNFATQAVIAMENARLLTETREALEQQTATTEVLQVINSSPGDLAPVFDSMLEKAMRLCEADFGLMLTVDGAASRVVAERDVPEPLTAFLARHTPDIGPHTFFGRAILGRSILHTADMREEAAYRSGQPLTLTAVNLAGVRALLMAPLLKDNGVAGVFAIFRREPRPFSDKQIALLQNFAAQAVIAMENARLLTETREALEQQTAVAQVLGVVNSSPGDLAPVFDAILEKAHTLCGAAIGALLTFDGESFGFLARKVPPDLAEVAGRPFKPGPQNRLNDLIQGEPLLHILDAREVLALAPEDPQLRATVEVGGMRSFLAVPLRKDGRLIGAITAARREVRPFSDKQIALLQNFAAQAVIAMENARLLTETREALAQQTATAEVLQVINSSPGNLAPIFDAMLERAIRLCEGIQGTLWTFDGEQIKLAAAQGFSAELIEVVRDHRERQDPGVRDPVKRILYGERLVQIVDMAAEPWHGPAISAAAQIGGVGTIIFAALVKDATPLGAFAVARREVRPFSDKQIALLQNFAAQAVIAMENARLITETREALEQQTATAEVLQVINSSPGDLAPVFDAMLDKAMRLCEAPFGALRRFDGRVFRAIAARDASGAAAVASDPIEPDPGSASERLVLGEEVVHIPDVVDTEAYRSGVASRLKLVELTGARTALWVALRKNDVLLGDFALYRKEVRPFSDKQIALLQNFAAEAVIAIENARLLTETREALQQQTATAEVLQVINSSPGVLAPVFDAILEKAHTLCGADHGGLVVYDGEHFRGVAEHGLPAQFAELLRKPFRPEPGSFQDRLIRGDSLVHVADVTALDMRAVDDLTYQRRRASALAGIRTLLFLPLRKDQTLLGYITAYRREVRPFSEKQIALLRNFAEQAVIAMENARLLTETREALEQQTATAEVLQVMNSSPGDLAPVFAHRPKSAHSGRGTVVPAPFRRWPVSVGMISSHANRLLSLRPSTKPGAIEPHKKSLRWQ